MVLHADAHAEFLAMIGAFPEIVRDPGLNLVPGMPNGYRFPGLVSHLRIGEHSDHRSAQPGRHLYPFLDVFDSGVANGFVRRRKVIPDTRSADTHAKVGSSALETIDVRIGGHRWVAGEIVTRGIEAVELVLCGEFQDFDQRRARASALD